MQLSKRIAWAWLGLCGAAVVVAIIVIAVRIAIRDPNALVSLGVIYAALVPTWWAIMRVIRNP